MPVSNKSKWGTSPEEGAFIIYKFKRWYFYLQYIHLYIYIFQLPLFLWFNTRIALFLSEVYIHQYIYMFQWPKFLQIHTGIAFFFQKYTTIVISTCSMCQCSYDCVYFYQKFLSIGISTCSNGHWHNKSAVLGACHAALGLHQINPFMYTLLFKNIFLQLKYPFILVRNTYKKHCAHFDWR